MPLNSGILQQIAKGSNPGISNALALGLRQGNELQEAQQRQAQRSALAEIAQAFGSGGPEAAIETAGRLGQLAPALQVSDRLSRERIAEQRANQPLSAVGKLRDDLKSGRISQQDFRDGLQAIQSRVGGVVSVSPGSTLVSRTSGQPIFQAPNKPTKLSPSERKAKRESENNAVNLEATLRKLGEADALVDRAFSGFGAGVRGALGTNLPDAVVPDAIADREGALATSELGKILSTEAIQAMAQALTGATTNFELQKFVEILADPSSPPELKARTIKRMKDLAANQLALEQERIGEFEGGQEQQAQSPRDANQSLAIEEAQEAIAAGKDPAIVRQRLEEAGFDPTGLDQ